MTKQLKTNIKIDFKPINNIFSNIDLELLELKKENPYYSVEDEFDEDDGTFDKILEEEYEKNKDFYEELKKKYSYFLLAIKVD